MSQTQNPIAIRRTLPIGRCRHHMPTSLERLEAGLVKGGNAPDGADAAAVPETTPAVVALPDDSLAGHDAIRQRIETLEQEMMSLRRADAWTRKNRERHGQPVRTAQAATDAGRNRIIIRHNTARFPHIAGSYTIVHTQEPVRIQNIVRIRVPSHLLVNPLAILHRRMEKTEGRIQKLLHRLYDRTTSCADERRDIRVSYCCGRHAAASDSDSDSESETATETEDCF